MDNKIVKISKPMLLKWNNKIRELDTIEYRTKNKVISSIRSIYKFANTYYDVPDISNVLKNIKKAEAKAKDYNTWTIEEFNTFIDCIKEPVYHAYFTFLFWTGCRRGEAIALNKDDLNGDVITISKSIRTKNEGIKEPKTASSIRKIKLDTNTLAEIKQLAERKGTVLFGDYDYLKPTNIQRVFERAIKESGVKKIRIHDLRHSHATMLINNGVNIVAVSKRLGHSTIDMTLKVYTHLLEKTDEEMMNKLEELHN